MNLEFFQQTFRKILTYEFSWKSNYWETCCTTRADGQTKGGRTVGHEAANSRFCNFAKTPKTRNIFMEVVVT